MTVGYHGDLDVRGLHGRGCAACLSDTASRSRRSRACGIRLLGLLEGSVLLHLEGALGDNGRMEIRRGGSGPTLTHPLFWAALALLVVNDHVLKQARVLPGVVTGKLSDFAGMLVAPVLLVAIVRTRTRVGRGAVFALVGGLFVLLKLFHPFADLLEKVTAHTPLPWRLWCDPTDLVALAVLPLGWWLAAKNSESVERPRLGACLHTAGLLVGVFACAATSVSTERYRGTAFLFNGTARTQTLRLYRLQTPLDCDRPVTAPADWPGRDAFTLQSCPILAPGDLLPLDEGWTDLGRWDDLGTFSVDSHFDAGVIGPPCDAVLLQAEGLEPIVVAWNGVKAIQLSGAERFGDEARDPHGLVLERAGERLFVEGTALLQVMPAGFEPSPTTCPNGER